MQIPNQQGQTDEVYGLLGRKEHQLVQLRGEYERVVRLMAQFMRGEEDPLLWQMTPMGPQKKPPVQEPRNDGKPVVSEAIAPPADLGSRRETSAGASADSTKGRPVPAA